MTRTMKDSGVEWIGQIPEKWKVGKLKYFIDIYGRIGFRGYTQNDLVGEGEGAITLSPSNFNDMKMNYSKCSYLSWPKYYESPEIQIQNNDILFVKTGSTYGKSVLVKDLPMEATINPQLIVLKNVKINLNFCAYMFQTSIIKHQVEISVVGGTIPTISQSKIENYYLILPPLPEQQAIADYLDDKCAQIDNITATINEQIEVLKQYKKSVITEAVTKGLDPNAPMKDSGVEWIGQIPEHWNIEKFKYDFTFSKGLQITKADLTEEGCPVISYGQIHSKINNSVSVNFKLIRFVDDSYQEDKNAITQYGDIIWADTSEDYDGIGNSIFVDSNKNIFAGYHTIITRPLFDKLTKYFAYLFQTDIWRLQLRKQATGIKVFSITQKMLKNSSILIPPLSEQQAIADYLDDKCAQIDAVVADKQAQLETLAAYKKSLIYEYVTGKKSVPGFEEA